MKRWIERTLWGAWGAVIVLLLARHLIAQRLPYVAVLVYSPPQLYLLGLTVVALLSGTMRAWRLSCVTLASLFFIAGPAWEWRTHHPPLPVDVDTNPDILRVMTCNHGQNNGHTLADVIRAQRPHVIAMQEALEFAVYLPNAPEYAPYPHRGQVGEFVLLSQYPIRATQWPPFEHQRADGSKTMWLNAVRFQVAMPKSDVVIWSAHLLAPRKPLLLYKGGLTKEERARERQFFDDQAALVRLVNERVRQESLPTLLVGDMNLPPVGSLYRDLTRGLLDAQREAGVGYGFTLPGDDKGLWSIGARWMRIDDVLCDARHWDVLRCEVEPPSKSQHSAVSALLRLR